MGMYKTESYGGQCPWSTLQILEIASMNQNKCMTIQLEVNNRGEYREEIYTYYKLYTTVSSISTFFHKQ